MYCIGQTMVINFSSANWLYKRSISCSRIGSGRRPADAIAVVAEVAAAAARSGGRQLATRNDRRVFGSRQLRVAVLVIYHGGWYCSDRCMLITRRSFLSYN